MSPMSKISIVAYPPFGALYEVTGCLLSTGMQACSLTTQRLYAKHRVSALQDTLPESGLSLAGCCNSLNRARDKAKSSEKTQLAQI